MPIFKCIKDRLYEIHSTGCDDSEFPCAINTSCFVDSKLMTYNEIMTYVMLL